MFEEELLHRILKAVVMVFITLVLFTGLVSSSVSEVFAAAVETVTNTNDSGAGSLRMAITNVNPGGTININVTGQITLGSELQINKNMTINGPGETSLQISGNNAVRVFNIQSATVAISDLTIQDGDVTDTGGGVFANAEGGGIYSAFGTVTLRNVTVSDNSATASSGSSSSGARGAGIYNDSGTLTLRNVTVSNNTATSTGGGTFAYAYGGGIYSAFGTVTLRNVTVSDNSATASGGSSSSDANGAGIYNDSGPLTLTDVTVNSNSATSTGGGTWGDAYGGGIYSVFGTVTLTNVTVSDNSVTASGGSSSSDAYGAGIYNDSGALTLTNVTVSSNSATANGVTDNYAYGAGIYNTTTLNMTNVTVSSNSATASGGAGSNSFEGGGIYGDALLVNTIISNNLPDNCSISFTVVGTYSLDSGNTCALAGVGDIINTDPLLGPLQDNGGPTLTHALLPGSPAIDTGNNSIAPPDDQRGYIRIWDGDGDSIAVVDIGAYEFNAPVSIPTLNQWGMIILIALLAGAGTLMLRKREESS